MSAGWLGLDLLYPKGFAAALFGSTRRRVIVVTSLAMTLPLILFFVFAGLAVIGALLMIFLREPIHSALALILVMVALAAVASVSNWTLAPAPLLLIVALAAVAR